MDKKNRSTCTQIRRGTVRKESERNENDTCLVANASEVPNGIGDAGAWSRKMQVRRTQAIQFIDKHYHHMRRPSDWGTMGEEVAPHTDAWAFDSTVSTSGENSRRQFSCMGGGAEPREQEANWVGEEGRDGGRRRGEGAIPLAGT
ncbi:hypothetical protein OsI_16699 [Oryza sativa Indica Group]|uniref:Uncharacterized protein n=1 Tax=Oryza sativa subsp. indica TaxID=39946 RepID=A2XVN9_ORYSI|nr:hypothetical protein OsI_16699 [Oryza sativa Indica Group]